MNKDFSITEKKPWPHTMVHRQGKPVYEDVEQENVHIIQFFQFFQFLFCAAKLSAKYIGCVCPTCTVMGQMTEI